MKKIKYRVVDSRGQEHTRTSPRTYTHAVVHHVPDRPAADGWPDRKGYSQAAWCGRADLAETEAARWRKHGWQAEVIKH
jgi:hypothetical protein